MIHAQNTKTSCLVLEDQGSAGTATGYVDTRGWDYLTVDVALDTAAATSNILRAIYLSESDTTSFTTTDKIVAFTGGAATSTSIGFVWPTAADTSNRTFVRMFMDLRDRKRYIELAITGPAAGLVIAGTATLSRGEVAPNTAAEAGAAAWKCG